mgnify:CR=1 FL=1
MTRTSTHTALITLVAIAAFASACGSETGTGVATQTDTATATDTAGASDTAASDAAAGDTTTTNDTTNIADTTADTAVADTSKADTAGSDLCDNDDQLCLTSCRNAKCSKELSACTTNAKCIGFNSCAGGCQQTPPVSPPAEVMGTTCVAKCATLAGEDGVKVYQSVAVCVQKGCIKSAYTPGEKCAQTDEACLQDCLTAECAPQSAACDDDKDCMSIFTCLGACPSGDQGCQQGCLGKAPMGAQQKFQSFLTCVQGNCI